MQETFTQHLKITSTELDTLLSLKLSELLNLAQFQAVLNSLDVQLLRETLPTAGSVLAQKLPAFYDWLKNELGVKRVPETPDHATTWVVNFLNNKESLTHLVELHRPIPRVALEHSVPRLVATFDGVEDEKVRQEWQKAIAGLCLPLVVDAREREHG
jgi:hypothetical protein